MGAHEDYLADVAGMHPELNAGDLAYSTNISLQHKYIFVENPKCGCSSTKLWLHRLELQDPSFTRAEFADNHKREYSPLLSARQVGSFRRLAQDPGFFKFCFVRHPASRLVSTYLDKILRNLPPKLAILKHLNLPAGSQVSFDQFVQAVCEQPTSAQDSHWRSQYYQTFQAGISYDFIGRFENLAADLRAAATRIGHQAETYLAAELRNETDSTAKLDQYLTPALIELIYDRYLIDFDYFDYEKMP